MTDCGRLFGSTTNITLRLLDYCRRNDWAGYDPYDALNSRFFAATPFSRSRMCRIVLTQLLKRLPFNIRPLLLISKEQNPKALALFLMAFVRLSRIGLIPEEGLIEEMVERLATLRSPGSPYWCWGYSFPWQGRRVLVPRGRPNLVCTTFAAAALLDAYEAKKESRFLEMATRAVDYMLDELYWEDGDAAGFCYPLPSVRARIHNANFMAAALLLRLQSHCRDRRFERPALKATRYSVARQNRDGSWYYGEDRGQRWIDNFHTGYDLCALRSIEESVGTEEFSVQIGKGFEFYRTSFFDGTIPKYFHDRTYPIDIHSVSQTLITLLTLKGLRTDNGELAASVLGWAVTHMLSKRGYFFYRRLTSMSNRISYMRWSQAWMLLALSTFLEEGPNGEG